MEITIASTATTLSQFQPLRIPKFKFSVESSSGRLAMMKLTSHCRIATSFNFQTSKCSLLTCPQAPRRDIGLKKLTCRASSGLEVSVADSGDSVTVKKAQIVVESQDDDKIQVRVDLNGSETQRVFDLVLTNLARTAPPIPGFRRDKGGKTTKVPKSFLLGVLGEQKVTEFVLREIVSSTVAQFVKKENLKVKEDTINTTQSAEELKASFKPGSEFGFTVIIELQSPEDVDARSSELETIETPTY